MHRGEETQGRCDHFSEKRVIAYLELGKGIQGLRGQSAGGPGELQVMQVGWSRSSREDCRWGHWIGSQGPM